MLTHTLPPSCPTHCPQVYTDPYGLLQLVNKNLVAPGAGRVRLLGLPLLAPLAAALGWPKDSLLHIQAIMSKDKRLALMATKGNALDIQDISPRPAPASTPPASVSTSPGSPISPSPTPGPAPSAAAAAAAAGMEDEDTGGGGYPRHLRFPSSSPSSARGSPPSPSSSSSPSSSPDEGAGPEVRQHLGPLVLARYRGVSKSPSSSPPPPGPSSSSLLLLGPAPSSAELRRQVLDKMSREDLLAYLKSRRSVRRGGGRRSNLSCPPCLPPTHLSLPPFPSIPSPLCRRWPWTCPSPCFRLHPRQARAPARPRRASVTTTRRR
jgi:hypothetical protein